MFLFSDLDSLLVIAQNEPLNFFKNSLLIFGQNFGKNFEITGTAVGKNFEASTTVGQISKELTSEVSRYHNTKIFKVFETSVKNHTQIHLRSRSRKLH